MEKFSQQPDDFEKEVNELEEKIKNAESFDDLYTALDEAEVIEGSHETLSAAETRQIIERLRARVGGMSGNDFQELKERGADFSVITRSHGLRSKVGELLIKEREAKDKERWERSGINKDDLEGAKELTVEDFEGKIGEKVVVRRTSGAMEGDWQIRSVFPTEGEVEVVKEAGDGTNDLLVKKVSFDDLKKWQSEN